MADLLEKFSYTLLGPVNVREAWNTHIKVRKNADDSLWEGKILRPLSCCIENFQNTGKPRIRFEFYDLHQRAILGFRLAELCGLKSLRSKIISAGSICGFEKINFGYDRMDDNVFLTEFGGVPLSEYLAEFSGMESSDIANKEDAILSFVFNIWIGNYDNKESDYLVDEEKNLISIDYNLLGPAFRYDQRLSLGSWIDAFDIESPADTGWCVGNGKIFEYVKDSAQKRRQLFESAVKKINFVSIKEIKKAMAGLSFYYYGSLETINDIFFDFLIERRSLLNKTIDSWISAGFPRAELPKNNIVRQ